MLLLKNQTGEWLQFRGETGDDYSLSPILLVPIDESYGCETDAGKGFLLSA